MAGGKVGAMSFAAGSKRRLAPAASHTCRDRLGSAPGCVSRTTQPASGRPTKPMATSRRSGISLCRARGFISGVRRAVLRLGVQTLYITHARQNRGAHLIAQCTRIVAVLAGGLDGRQDLDLD
jgi:hypothetical protein